MLDMICLAVDLSAIEASLGFGGTGDGENAVFPPVTCQLPRFAASCHDRYPSFACRFVCVSIRSFGNSSTT
ncbi:hypothetical protein RBSH_04145 [Rhodopirellula baltica SH28]|uniref:Uncharacterized protein n=2 Tax=Rhodopirellula baltica TaxID=265606 RepID=F2ASN0_RHOBT|nr:hypothetical protein RBWH47_00395 [Rhodopirellula baltica WH47]EKK00418.1 hypothetical protein RBSH_04145 [Rhodopirellula baltica SH28]